MVQFLWPHISFNFLQTYVRVLGNSLVKDRTLYQFYYTICKSELLGSDLFNSIEV